jgi:hypothetical protein
MWTVDWDGDFVIGGDGNRRLTPNFRLKEFRSADGKVLVHRELVSALQLLRDRLARGMSVQRTDADGLGAVVTADRLDELHLAAEAMRARGMFSTVEAVAGGVAVKIPSPASPRSLALEEALETAFSVTAGFETAGDKFQQITGNFDGAGFSFGPAQVNFGTGTLVPLFRKFKTADEAALRQCFSDPDDYDDWLRIMELPSKQQIAWANGLSTGRGGHDVVEPWKGYFQAVGRVPRFREIMVDSILRDYGGKLARVLKRLQELRPGIAIDHLRCICALYDLVTQQGSLERGETVPGIRARIAAEDPKDQFHLVRIAVEERSRAADPPWRADAESRRVGILEGVPHTVGERQRANIQFYMLRDAQVTGVDRLVAGQTDVELARVTEAIAGGRTLLV